MASPFRDGLAALRDELVLLEEQRRDVEARMAALKERARRSRPKTNWAQAISNAIYIVLLLCLGALFVTAVVAAVMREKKSYPTALILREAALEETKRLAKAAKLSMAQSQSTGESPCPSIGELIAAKRIAPMRSQDPWGRPYQIVCASYEKVWVYSAGEDGVPHTVDDIASDMPRRNLEVLTELAR